MEIYVKLKISKLLHITTEVILTFPFIYSPCFSLLDVNSCSLIMKIFNQSPIYVFTPMILFEICLQHIFKIITFVFVEIKLIKDTRLILYIIHLFRQENVSLVRSHKRIESQTKYEIGETSYRFIIKVLISSDEWTALF